MSSAKTHPVIEESIRLRSRTLALIWDKSCRFHTLRATIKNFLDRGLRDGVLDIKSRKSKHKIEFRKYIVVQGQYGIELVVQDFGGPENHLSQFKEYCIQSGIEFILDQEDDENNVNVLRIDCAKDIDKAHSLLIVLFSEILGLPANCKFDIEERDVSPWMEVIDSPDQRPSPPDEGIKLNDEWLARVSGMRPRSSALSGLASLCKFAGLVGLVATLVFQKGDWAGVTAYISSTVLHVPWSGLVSFILLLIGFLAIFTDAYWRLPKRTGSEVKLVPIPKTFRGMLLVLLGRPINWISVCLLAFAIYSWISV